MKYTKTLLTVLFSLLVLPFIIACGGGSSTAQTGTLALKLIDAPGDFEAVYVTIKEVQVHKSSDEEIENTEEGNENTEEDSNVAEDQDSSDEEGWITVVEPNETFNLLELQNGVEAVLGDKDLTEGNYTQMRLILGTEDDGSENIQEESHPFANYVIVDGSPLEITIPSSLQTGIKLIKNFDIVAGTTTKLTLDFDANKSIHITGNEQYTMKPTIKIIQE